jgi:hypothetical protein
MGMQMQQILAEWPAVLLPQTLWPAVLLLQTLTDSNSRNSEHEQNISAHLKLRIAPYYMTHCGDAIHLEAASGLSKATALKYVHQVAELIFTHLTKKWMGKTLLKDDGYMEGCRERFCLRN